MVVIMVVVVGVVAGEVVVVTGAVLVVTGPVVAEAGKEVPELVEVTGVGVSPDEVSSVGGESPEVVSV